MTKPKVFVSHIHEEEDLAKLINDKLIDRHLLGAVNVFVSSDSTTNPGGTSWLRNIEDALLDATVLLILASPKSVSKPWINIEGGAAWLRSLQSRTTPSSPQVRVMPLCHSGLTPGALPLPWSTFNAVEIRTQGGLQQVLETIALAASIRAPRPELAELAAEVQALEERYTVYTEIENRIREVVKVLGANCLNAFTQKPPPDQYWSFPDVRLAKIGEIDAALLWLKAKGHIDYLSGHPKFMSTTNNGSSQTQDIFIRPSDEFLKTIRPQLKL